MNSTTTAAFVPTRAFIETLSVGDLAPNCFGEMRQVVSVTYRGVDINGRAYVGYYVEWGSHNGRISHSLKEGGR